MADAQPKEAVVIDDVWKASAYGEIEKLTELLNVDASCVNKPDAGGYLPLQWAALNNRVAAASLLLERGADVNACDGQGQTALHWAAVRGAVPASELLLRAGARLDKADSRGYTPAHVAAQYGHTAVLYHFAVRWDANMDVLDGDGRAPLHWAAYKGFADACRLLLMLDSDPQRVDREGCNPLHWAAIKGNSEAVHLLTQAGGPSAILATDGQGSTAAQLAQEKGHTMLASYLLSVARHAGSKKKPMQNRGLSIGLAAGIVALVLMFINACVLAPALPAPSAGTTLASYLVVLCVGAGFYFMYRTATRDPGILTGGLETLMLPRPGAGAAARLDIPTLWAGNWGSLCVTCKLVRPLGAKHCSVINKCVARFDHFCPWVGNTIGKRNHRDFAAFLVLQSFALLVSVLTAFTRASHSGMDFAKLVVVCPSLLAFLAIDLVVALPVIMLTSAQVTQLARNITTNELANAHRYPYLRNKDGLFANPFDKGCVQNLRNFVMLSPDQRDREIEYGETAITPLVDTELHTLLSGGNRASGVTTVSIPPNANARGSANGGAARDV